MFNKVLKVFVILFLWLCSVMFLGSMFLGLISEPNDIAVILGTGGVLFTIIITLFTGKKIYEIFAK